MRALRCSASASDSCDNAQRSAPLSAYSRSIRRAVCGDERREDPGNPWMRGLIVYTTAVSP